jgi:hypothetical protein
MEKLTRDQVLDLKNDLEKASEKGDVILTTVKAEILKLLIYEWLALKEMEEVAQSFINFFKGNKNG